MKNEEDFGQCITIQVMAWDLDGAAQDALFDRIADAAHALDEEVICFSTGKPTT